MVVVAKEPVASSAVEDYVKTIYQVESAGGTAVATNVLAARLGVTASSASGMVRRLAAAGLVEYERYHGVHLSEPEVLDSFRTVGPNRMGWTDRRRKWRVPGGDSLLSSKRQRSGR